MFANHPDFPIGIYSEAQIINRPNPFPDLLLVLVVVQYNYVNYFKYLQSPSDRTPPPLF